MRTEKNVITTNLSSIEVSSDGCLLKSTKKPKQKLIEFEYEDANKLRVSEIGRDGNKYHFFIYLDQPLSVRSNLKEGRRLPELMDVLLERVFRSDFDQKEFKRCVARLKMYSRIEAKKASYENN